MTFCKDEEKKTKKKENKLLQFIDHFHIFTSLLVCAGGKRSCSRKKMTQRPLYSPHVFYKVNIIDVDNLLLKIHFSHLASDRKKGRSDCAWLQITGPDALPQMQMNKLNSLKSY